MEDKSTKSLTDRIVELESINKQLEEKNFLYESIFKESPIATQLYDKDGVSLKFNVAYKNLFGLPDLNEGIGKFNVLKDQLSIKNDINHLFERVYSGEHINHEFKYNLNITDSNWQFKKDTGTLKQWIFPVTDNEGNIKYAVTLFEDKTKEKDYQDDLKEKESFLESILLSIDDLLFVMDMKGNYIDYYQPDKSELYISPEAFIGKNYKELMPNNVIEPLDKAYKHIVEGGAYYQFDYTMPMERGVVWYNAKVTPLINSRGDLIGIVVVCRNINDRVKIREALQESECNLKKINQELSVSNTTKDKLFSIIAHDLRSPIGTVLALMDVINDDPFEYDESKMKEILSVVNRSISKTYILLDNLLNWSRSQLNMIKPCYVTLGLKGVVESSIEILLQQSQKKGVKLINRIDGQQLVKADENLLLTIVRNIISNALKFSNSGSDVIIESFFKDGMCIVKVQDSGIGMNQSKVKGLFQLENISSSKGTSGEQGTGLGLLICKNFIHMNKGEIWAESELGVGTSVYFSLPLT